VFYLACTERIFISESYVRILTYVIMAYTWNVRCHLSY